MNLSTDDIQRLGDYLPGAVAVYQIRDDGVSMIYFSDVLPSLLGFTHDEYVKRAAGNIIDLVVDQDKEYVRNAIAYALEHHHDVNCSYRVTMGSKVYHWMNVRGRYVGKLDGFPIFVAEFLDTTQETKMHSDLLDHASNGIYVCDAASRELLYANQKALAFFECDDDFIGYTCYEYFRGRNEICPWCAFNHMEGESAHVEGADDPDLHGYLKIDCTKPTWFGRPAFCVSFEDVTGERLAQEELRQAKEQLDDAMDAIPSGVGIYDIEGSSIHRVYLNDGYYRMIGSTRAAHAGYEGRDSLYTVAPDDAEGVRAELKSCMEENRMFHCSLRLLYGDGVYRWVDLRAAHRALSGDVERFYAAYFDIDRRVQAEQNLRSLVENIPAALLVYRLRDGQITIEQVNAGVESIAGLSADDIIEQGNDAGIEYHVHPEDISIVLDGLARLFSDAHETEFVYRNRPNPESPYVWIHYRGRSVLQDDGSQVAYAALADVTDAMKSKRAEDKIVEIVSHLPLVSLLLQFYPGGTVKPVSFSEEFCRMMGITQKQAWHLYADDALASAHPDDRRLLADYAIARIHEHDTTMQSLAHRFVRPDGRIVWVMATFSFFTVDEKEYGYMVYTDITDVKERETAFKKRYLEQQSYLDSMSDSYEATMRINLSANRVEVINGADPLAALDEGPLSYQDMMDNVLIPAAVREQDKELLRQRLTRDILLEDFNRGDKTVSCDYLYCSDLNCEPRWVRASMNLMLNPETDDIMAFAIIANVNDEIDENRIVSRMMSTDECDFIAIIDVARRTIDFRRVVEKSETSPVTSFEDYDSMQTANVAKYPGLVDVSEVVRGTSIEAIAASLAEEDVYSYAFTIIDSKGDLHRKLMRYSFLDREVNRSKVLAIRTDVTETYLREQADTQKLERALHQAEAASKAKTDFLSRMSHDIRTPLNGVIGMTGLAMEELVSPKVHDYLEKIDESGKFLLSLVNDILDVSKAESGKIVLHPQRYDYREFEKYVHSVISPLCVQKHIDFKLSIPKTAPMLLVDKLRFNQIFFNLLSNAVKFTPEKGRICLSVNFEMQDSKSCIGVFVVEDNGIGMSAEYQKRLFQPFEQEHTNRNDERNGSGLGLSIVKSLVDIMGGMISVKSAEGVGTTFTVRLPLQLANDGRQRDDHEAVGRNAEPAPQFLCGKHLLVVEDNPINVQVIVSLLEKQGGIVEVAQNGKRAIDVFEASPNNYYDMVLMDVRMPVMDGLEATRILRKLMRSDARSVPILAMTANVYEDDVRACLEAGMNAHTAKPIVPAELFGTMAELLA